MKKTLRICDSCGAEGPSCPPVTISFPLPEGEGDLCEACAVNNRVAPLLKLAQEAKKRIDGRQRAFADRALADQAAGVQVGATQLRAGQS